jgi:hypothetical protein
MMEPNHVRQSCTIKKAKLKEEQEVLVKDIMWRRTCDPQCCDMRQTLDLLHQTHCLLLSFQQAVIVSGIIRTLDT